MSLLRPRRSVIVLGLALLAIGRPSVGHAAPEDLLDTLTVNVQGSGSVTKNPDLPVYLEGTHVALTATPATDWHFVGWSGDASGSANPLDVTMDASKSITATFAIDTHELDVIVSGPGTVSRNPDLLAYDHGSQVTLTAVPATGYHLVSWSGAATGSANPLSVVMDDDKSITATFAVNTYELNVIVDGTGSVAADPLETAYAHGTTVTLTATGGPHHHFVSWSGDAGGSTNPLTVVMDDDKSITATFAIDTHSLDVTVIGSGSVTRSPDQAAYDYGTTVTLTATPASHWHFVGWSDDATGSASPVDVVVDGNTSVTATFAIDTHTLDVTVIGSGSVTRSPDQAAYDYGTSVTVTATPASHWHFVGWSGDATGSANPVGIVMDRDRNVTATFAIDTHTLDVAVSGNGTVSRSPDQPSYDYGTTVTLTATPATGWHFVGWSGDATGSANPVGIAVDGDRNVTATFAIDTHTLDVAVVGSGSVSRSPDQAVYDYGTTVTLTATAGPHWHFVGWSGDATGAASPLGIVMDSDRNVTATFAIDTHTLDVAVAGSGSVSRSPDQAVYDYGTTVTLTATPATGWHFVGWSGDATGSANPVALVMNGNRSVTATFAIDTHTLNVTVSGNGTVSRSPDQPSYDHGTTVTLTATPAAGWHLVGWSGDATGSANPLDVVMSADRSITATFAADAYTLSVTVVGSGSVARMPDQPTYAYGSTVTLTATPAANWHFTGWSGGATGSANPITVTLFANTSVTATFAIDTHHLTVITVGSGSVQRKPSLVDYPHGTLVTLTATAGPGFHLRGWEGDLTSTANPVSIAMNADHTVYAHFSPDGVSLQLPANFESQLVAAGLDRPTGMAFLPDGRLVVVEQQSGWIRLIADGVLGAIDPIGIVDSVATTDGEQGLLGVAVDPQWPARPYVYVIYNALGNSIRLSRYTAEGDLEDGSSGFLSLTPGSRYDVLRDLQDTQPIHNGGTLRFGPDGLLYVSLGDDGFACQAQDSTRLVGAVLRIDVSGLPGAGGPPDRASLVPPTNPYAASPQVDRRLIWAKGFRNPFRFHIDPVDGTMFVADVGFTTYEELDRVDASGANAGWPYFEGPNAFVPDCDGATAGPGVQPPIYWYDRPNVAAAVISAGVYRPSSCANCDFPADYSGDYFFSDFYMGFLRRLKSTNGTWSVAPPVPGQPSPTNWGMGFEQVSDYLVGRDGALWYCRNTIDYQGNTGEIGRVFYLPPIADVAGGGVTAVRFGAPFPSPAREAVRFSYALPVAGHVRLEVFDPLGRRVRRVIDTDHDTAGRHEVRWDVRSDAGARVAAGVYLAQLEAGGRRLSRKVVVAR